MKKSKKKHAHARNVETVRTLRRKAKASARAGRKNPVIAELVPLGARIRAERVRRGLTQEQLAGAIGTSVQDVGQVENGWRSTSVIRVFRFAAALGCEPEWLLSGISPRAHEILREHVNASSRSAPQEVAAPVANSVLAREADVAAAAGS